MATASDATLPKVHKDQSAKTLRRHGGPAGIETRCTAGARREGAYLGSKRAHLEDALYGEHGGEDEVEVAQHVHELQRCALKL
jgi:hypothetical protein